MPNYQNGKIYKIINDENDLVYYGSTTVPLWQRMGKHKAAHKSYLEGKRTRNITSFELLKYKNVQIILVEDCPCERKEQLYARERFWIENNKCVNKVIPGRTQKEWREDNKEYLKELNKKWIEENKEKVKERHKEHHKEYYPENKQKILDYQKKHYQENKEKIKKFYSEKVKCECGCEVSKNHIARHKKSKKHFNLII